MSMDMKGEFGGSYTDEDYQKMQDGMKDGAGVRLPFDHLSIYAVNGSPKMKQNAESSPTAYYGGWNVNSECVNEMRDRGTLKVPLDQAGWKLTEKSGNEGAYSVYETRSIHLAPITKRLRWINEDGKSGMPEYDEKHKRSHLQVLCLVGCTKQVNGVPTVELVAPGVVTVKGIGQTEPLKKAFVEWSKAIDSLRDQMNAKGVPLFGWWETIGTRGEAEFKTVGTKTKNTVTPVKALMASERLTVEQVWARRVGPVNFKLASELLSQSQEWVRAWSTPTGQAARGQQQQQPGDANEGGPPPGRTWAPRGQQGGAPPQDSYAGGNDDSIPF